MDDNKTNSFIDFQSLIYATIILLVYLTLKILKDAWTSYDYFKSRGIPTPPYTFLLGHAIEIRKGKNTTTKLYEYEKAYGKTFGFYDGMQPYLCTSDLDIIQEVFIKQFNNFPKRRRFPLEQPEHGDEKNLLTTNLEGRWKRMRLIMNPTFSSSKIREMNPLIDKCCDRLIDQFKDKEEQEIDIAEYLKRFTMDTIWNCALGIDSDLQNEKDNIYYHKSVGVFDAYKNLGLIRFLSWVYDGLDRIIYPLDCIITKVFGQNTTPEKWLNANIGQLIDMRKKQNNDKRDYMNLMIEVMSEETTKEHDTKSVNELADLKIEKKMTRMEVISNLRTFMLAGYETTSSALGFAIHSLATHPEVQQKLFEEINENFGPNSGKNMNTDNVKELVYLDNFIKESQRYNLSVSFERQCANETTIKGIKMTPGLNVRPNHHSICYDKEIWGPTDPEIFDPTRHETKRHPMAYVAFGHGPRNCVGMKFAIIEMKLALCRLVLNFEFKRSSSTPDKLKGYEAIVLIPYDYTIIMKKRDMNH